MIGALPTSLRNWLKPAQRDEGRSVLHPHLSLRKTFNDSFATGLARPAAEKFAGAWLACFLVMARGGSAFSFEHVRIAAVCGVVGAVVAVALITQMDRTTDSVTRQVTISAIVTFIGDIFARRSHFSPQWVEPMITGAVSGGIAFAAWHTKRFAKSLLG